MKSRSVSTAETGLPGGQNEPHTTCFFNRPTEYKYMTDADDVIKRFLQKADDAYGEYDEGYADADATLRRLERHVEELREAREGE